MDAQEIKDQITELWRRVDRPGVDQLVEFLNNSDFFTAPCSTQFHLAEPGGLAKHSLNVYQLLREKVERYGLDIPKESIIVCGLGHDLCKVHFYGTAYRNVKENGIWVEKQVYIVQDQLPLGHGEKSVIMLQDYIRLTPDEQMAIRWHMVAFDPGIHFGYPSGHPFRAASKNPLVVLLFTADYEASQVLEASAS